MCEEAEFKPGRILKKLEILNQIKISESKNTTTKIKNSIDKLKKN